MGKAKRFFKRIKREAKRATTKVGRTTKKAIKKAAGRSKRVIRNTLEGSLSGSVHLIRTIADITADVPRKFQKDFFKGLLELGKSPLEIIEAAAETGAATLGIAFANLIEVWGGRPLKPQEKKEARRIFGRSIPLSQIRIATGMPVKVIHKMNKSRPFTTLKVICYESEKQLRQSGMATLIHELTHVWQYQKTGPVYMIEALKAQAKKGAG